MWAAYMARCARGALYAGAAKDVAARVRRHNSGRGSKAVVALGLPVALAYERSFPGKAEALRHEAWLKTLPKAAKERLAKAWAEGSRR